ncbi:dihydropyrimidinase [Ruminococcaceae bacterium OttesenSCG-928-L11]|nr:dihydropyrimidinase [Ruminococcaceae bacterium OttesenSCG-928-L11]
MSIWIKGARIGTSREEFIGDVLVEGERIVRVAPGGLSPEEAPGAEVLDATGLVLLPGGVDVHTHFDLDVGIARSSDTFYTGTVAAAWGGTTTVVDHMAFGPRGCDLLHQVNVYRRLAEDAVVDYGFHGVVQHVDNAILDQMETLLEQEGISSLKVYMTYDYALKDEEFLAVLNRAKALGMTVCAHCENDGMLRYFRERCLSEGTLAPRYHAASRPPEAEAEAVFRFLQLARLAEEARAYVVHLSSAQALDAFALARRTGQRNIYAETCPQYLFLEESLYRNGAEGLKYIMSPPLRKDGDRQALWQGIKDGQIDAVATDHCPFYFATQKQMGAGDFTRCPNGIPGVELRYPLLFSEGYLGGRLSLPELVGLCCTRPAELFGLLPRKGDIREGADADLVLFDPAAEWTVTGDALHEQVDYTPYEGMALRGRPVMTVSRGALLVRDGQFLGKKGRGKYLRRAPQEWDC